MATTTSTTGWPDSTNTGVPAGVTLTPSGGLVITKAGTVISGLNITGTVTVEAANVTIENCTITAATGGGVVTIGAGVTGAVVQNCTINGTGANNAGSTGIFGSGTFNGNNIYNVENGIAVTQGSTSTLIENNYIHNLLASGSPHYDGIQIDGGLSGVTIEHNTVINPFGQTSAIMLDNYFGALSNINVTNNLLEGGGYTIYDDGHFNSSAISGVSITNNHLGGGQWGNTDFNGTNPTYTGNVSDAATVVATLNTAANDAAPTTPPPPASPPAAPAISSWSPDTGVVGDAVTDASTLTLKGTAAAGSTVKIYDGATQIGSTTADSTGAWTDVTPTLSNATHVLTATATTASGSSAASSAVDVTVDTVAPAAPVLTSDTVVSTNHVLVSGTAEANSTVTVYDGSSVVGTGVTTASGGWSVTTSALTTGSHVLTAAATDVAGNVSAISHALDPVIGTSTGAGSGTGTGTGTGGGWPDATNTGVPAGVTLTPSGSLVITKAGTVISGLNITGTVTIEAANVTIENCTITSNAFSIVKIASGVTGAVVQNCTINGTGANNAGSTGIFGSGTFNGNNIYNVENGIAVSQGSSATVIENNYIHNLLASGSPHYDGIQIDGGLSNVTISHNTVINPFGQTSAVMLDNYFGALSNINVTNNLLEGGGYTIYDDGHFNSSAISGVSITNNHLGGGQWGNTDFNGTDPTYTGNVSDAATVVATLNTAANDAASTTSGAVPAPPTTTSSPPSATSSASVAPAVQTTTSTTSTHTPVDFTHLSENSSHVATLAGTADANSKVNVFDGAHEVGSVTTNASGAWTFSTGTLSGAVHTFTAQEVDSSGGVVAKSSGEAILASGSGSVLTGTSGNDYFTASGQNDTFVFANNFGQDVIKGFVPAGTGHDTIQLSATEFSNFASVLSHATQVGQDVVIHSGSDSLTLKDVKIGALSAHDFHFA